MPTKTRTKTQPPKAAQATAQPTTAAPTLTKKRRDELREAARDRLVMAADAMIYYDVNRPMSERMLDLSVAVFALRLVERLQVGQ